MNIADLAASLLLAVAVASPVHDGRHDFDFEMGNWKIHVTRLLHPLTGSSTWDSPSGRVHRVQKVWGGRASLAQLEVDDPAPRFLGLMLRLYDPQSRLWRVYWASSADGVLDAPLTGRFENGRGEFYGDDTWRGKKIRVRVVYDTITPASFRTVQAFSADGGKTWETNLIQTFSRELSARARSSATR